MYFFSKIYNLFKNYSKQFKVYYRIIKLLSVLIYSITHFYVKKMLTLYLYKVKPQLRLNLIKTICSKLEKINILYVKIFQSIALNEDLIYDNEKDYLINYCDNVDYNLLKSLQENYNITLTTSVPLASGIIGIVFDAIDASNTKVVVKMLKKNSEIDIHNAFDELLHISYICKYIPYINSFNITKLVADNKEFMLEQIDFTKEISGLERFAEKYKNNKGKNKDFTVISLVIKFWSILIFHLEMIHC